MNRSLSSAKSARTKASQRRGAASASERTLTREDRIYQKIFTAIVEHELPPGTKLTEEHLGQIFRVSRTSIRRVLYRLAHDNLVTLQRNRGASVARPTAGEVREVYFVRRLLEANMIRTIGASITSAQVHRLRRGLAAERAANLRGDHRRALIVSGEFHLELAGLLNNATLTKMLRELISRGALALAVYERPGRAGCRCDEHADIVEKLASGDGNGAADCMERHLSAIEAGLDLSSYERQPINLRELFAPARARR